MIQFDRRFRPFDFFLQQDRLERVDGLHGDRRRFHRYRTRTVAEDVGEPEETCDAMVPAHGNHPWTHPIREFGTPSS